MKAGLRIMRRVGQQNQRHRSSVVEHTLGKGEVEGSIPFGGFGSVVDVAASQHNVGFAREGAAEFLRFRPLLCWR